MARVKRRPRNLAWTRTELVDDLITAATRLGGTQLMVRLMDQIPKPTVEDRAASKNARARLKIEKTKLVAARRRLQVFFAAQLRTPTERYDRERKRRVRANNRPR